MAQQLGRYEIIAEIGRGAMGAVFQARDPKIDRVVAIKTISVQGVDAREMAHYRQRFFREAQAAGRLSAPGIVTIYDVDEDSASNTPFIVMEYVAGRTLDQFAPASDTIAMNTALDLVRQVADALDYAHSHGIVHRDIKPSNIIVTDDGQAKIADFGIARLSLSDATLPGHVLGTPAYMSPEQLNGKPVDGRSDLFSLGVIAYWLLTGEKPFTGDTLTQISFQVAFREPRPACEANPQLPPDFNYILGRALAKEPEKRYQTGKQFSLDVQDAAAGQRPRSHTAAVERTVVLANQTALPARVAAPATTDTRNFLDRIAGHLPLPQKLRRPVLLLGMFAMLVIAGVMAFSGSRPRTQALAPADLQIIGEHPFLSAHMAIWADGELRYDQDIHGSVHKHTKLFKTIYTTEGSIALTVPLREGNHKIRIRVQVPEQAYDEDSIIEGHFLPYGQKTLRATFTSRGMDLNWQE